jgi:hypothetical protein
MHDLAGQTLGEEGGGKGAVTASGVGAVAQQHDRTVGEQRGDRGDGALRVGQHRRAAGEGVAVAERRQMKW